MWPVCTLLLQHQWPEWLIGELSLVNMGIRNSLRCLFHASSFFQTVVKLGVLTLKVKAGCSIGGAHRRVRLSRCYLHYIHASRDLRSAFQLRRLVETTGPQVVFSSTALSL